jgi:hypothetical protein
VFDLPIPAGTTATIRVTVNHPEPVGGTASARRVGIAPNTFGVNLAVPDPLSLTAPENGTTDVDRGTALSWQERPGALYELTLLCAETAYSYHYFLSVMTTQPQTTIPDGTALGVPLPKATECTWFVTAHTDRTMSDVVGPDGLSPLTREARGPLRPPAFPSRSTSQ